MSKTEAVSEYSRVKKKNKKHKDLACGVTVRQPSLSPYHYLLPRALRRKWGSNSLLFQGTVLQLQGEFDQEKMCQKWDGGAEMPYSEKAEWSSYFQWIFIPTLQIKGYATFLRTWQACSHLVLSGLWGICYHFPFYGWETEAHGWLTGMHSSSALPSLITNSWKPTEHVCDQRSINCRVYYHISEATSPIQ